VVGQAASSTDPCLSSVYRNISHISERYAKLNGVCPYTDRRIAKAWFYAGVDPIVNYPPDYCSCGFKFPIWMNGKYDLYLSHYQDKITMDETQ
jgi:hypothetical protein